MPSLGIPVSWEGLGIGGIILLVLVSIIRGWLVPKIWVDILLREKDKTNEVQARVIENQQKAQEPVVRLLEVLNAEAEAKAKAETHVEKT